jgi:hypothetical protein
MRALADAFDDPLVVGLVLSGHLIVVHVSGGPLPIGAARRIAFGLPHARPARCAGSLDPGATAPASRHQRFEHREHPS